MASYRFGSGICKVCRLERALTQGGVMRAHKPLGLRVLGNPHMQYCKGTAKKPLRVVLKGAG